MTLRSFSATLFLALVASPPGAASLLDDAWPTPANQQSTAETVSFPAAAFGVNKPLP
jgi:hypothetical protein